MSDEERFITEKKSQEGKKPVVYISGGITNNPDYKKQFTKKYRELETKGFIVLSPLFINAPLEWAQYMHIDFAMVDVSDSIYMMKGWEESEGARIERLHAIELGLNVIYEDGADEVRS